MVSLLDIRPKEVVVAVVAVATALEDVLTTAALWLQQYKKHR